MSTTNVPLLLKGLTGGTTSERTVLNVRPTELEDTSRNIEVLRDSSFRPRRGVDFLGTNNAGDYMEEIRSVSTAAETSQESPSAIYVQFKTNDGEIVEKDIIFQDLKFKIYDHSNLAQVDSPSQTITPANLGRSNTEQKYYNVVFAEGDNRVFFASRKLQPGYFYLKSDNTLGIAYVTLCTRDLTTATEASDRVKINNKFYECIEDHTSLSSHTGGLDSYGELDFNRYWMELDNTVDISGVADWAAGNDYTTNIVKVSDKHSTLADNNPYGVWYQKNRVWWLTDDKLYYSQVAVDVEDTKTNTVATGANEYGLCLQEADPFDTADPDPVPSDGGTITPSKGKPWQVIGVQDSIFLGTSSEVIEIRGNTGSFSHTDFRVDQVINEGVNGIDNIVAADTQIYAFCTNNIWASTSQQRFSQSTLTQFLKVASKKIKSYYVQIPKLNKGTARAVFSPTNEKIYYFHNGISTTFDAQVRNTAGQNGYARSVMVVDIAGNKPDIDAEDRQFIENHIEIWDYADDAHTGGTYIAYAYPAAPTTPSFNTVQAAGDDVVVGADSVIVAGLSGSQQGSDEIVVLAMERPVVNNVATISFGIAKLESDSLTDWASDVTREVEYTAKADLGTQVAEDVTATKAIQYLLFVFEKLTDGTGSCLCRTSFNFAEPTVTGEGTGKTSDQTEVYKDTKLVSGGTVGLSNYKATWYKHRVRGRGMSLQISLENTPGKDFKLLGWGQLLKIRRTING